MSTETKLSIASIWKLFPSLFHHKAKAKVAPMNTAAVKTLSTVNAQPFSRNASYRLDSANVILGTNPTTGGNEAAVASAAHASYQASQNMLDDSDNSHFYTRGIECIKKANDVSRSTESRIKYFNKAEYLLKIYDLLGNREAITPLVNIYKNGLEDAEGNSLVAANATANILWHNVPKELAKRDIDRIRVTHSTPPSTRLAVMISLTSALHEDKPYREEYIREVLLEHYKATVAHDIPSQFWQAYRVKTGIDVTNRVCTI